MGVVIRFELMNEFIPHYLYSEIERLPFLNQASTCTMVHCTRDPYEVSAQVYRITI
eukprot:m.90497 g.90497  ORF g.90497 m.90497 type:complete len:56 (-) comp11850_c0_seq1:282-449(-)